MNTDDFRYMRRKKQILDLKYEDLKFLEPVNKKGPKKDKALLILHGFSSSPAVYRYLIPEISAYDGLFCPVLPGHGHSLKEFSNSTALAWQAKANQLCEELLAEYQHVDVLGMSLGGLLALNLCQQFQVHHLYLLSPAIKLNQNIKSLIYFAKFLKILGFQEVRNMAGNMLSETRAEIAYRKLPIKIIVEILEFIENFQMTALNCSVDLFLGLKDEVISSKQVQNLFMDLPNVTIHWLNNSAHVLPLDNDLNQIIQCIHNRGC